MFVTEKLCIFENIYRRDTVHSERFQFAVGVVADEIPSVLRFFQEMGHEPFVNDFSVMAY